MCRKCMLDNTITERGQEALKRALRYSVIAERIGRQADQAYALGVEKPSRVRPSDNIWLARQYERSQDMWAQAKLWFELTDAIEDNSIH